MAAIENVEWLNMNALRAYPIHEDSDTVPRVRSGARADGVSLPTCLIVDFAVTIAQDDMTQDIRVGLTELTHANGTFAFGLSANWDGESGLQSAPLARLTVRIADHAADTTYRFTGVGAFEDCVGWLTVGDAAAAAAALPEGSYTFAPGQCDFEVSTVRIAPRGVRSLSVVDRFGNGYRRLHGTVRLVGGTDVTLRSDAANNAIWIRAQSGTGYAGTMPCGCASHDEGEVEQLFTQDTIADINGMSVRRVQIVGEQCIDVTGDVASAKIAIANECGTPCCGCTELSYIDSVIATLNQSVADLKKYAIHLDARIADLQIVVAKDQATIRSAPGVLI